MDIKDLHKKFEELSENVQDALLSPSTAETIYNIGKSNNLTDEKISILAEIIGDVVMGISNDVDLSTLLKNLGLDQVATKNITDSTITIINQIKTGLTPTSQVEEGVVIKPTFAKDNYAQSQTKQTPSQLISSPKQEVATFSPKSPIRPGFIEPVTTSSSPRAEAAPGEIVHPAPFVLHEEKPLEGMQSQHQDLTTQRPTFYQPVFSSGKPRFEAYAKPKAATVELGGAETKKDLPTSLKTSPQQVRVVHYSEFKTQVDPFGGEPTVPISPIPAITPTIPPAPIHPNNVVDLKDLPLK